MTYLITSALPYVNNIPHLGNLICVVSADVYTRFLRSKGEKVISVLGTDEHGTTAEIKAKEEKLTPKQLVDKYFKIHTEIYDWFNCSFDCYGRTSDKENYEISQDIFNKLKKNKFITKKKIKQFYDDKEKTFLADRFVKGTCKFCKFDDAKGDQCDNCGKLLEPTELIKPTSTLSNTKPILKQTEHFYLELGKLAPELKKWIKLHQKSWSHNALSTTTSWLKEGLKSRAITRDLKWGIPVPVKGYENKVLYSWFDAPIGYISITKKSRKDWKSWWFNDKINLTQFMGKDNIPFHTILFPAYLIGTKEKYTLMKTINVNEYLNYESGKFSKSRGIGIFGNDAMNTGIHADIFRFYMIINRPEKNDSVFTWKDFQEKLNSELVGNYGNLVNRTLTFINRFFSSEIPSLKKEDLVYKKQLKKIEYHYETIELKKACKEILELSKLGNQYFQEQKPWELVKINSEKAGNVLANLVKLVKDLAILLEPITPEKSKEVFQVLGIKPSWKDLNKKLSEKQILKSRILFEKLDDTKELQEEFSGREILDDLDLRVAKILKVEKHGNNLYKLQVSLGKEKRQLVAGLQKHYYLEELKGKKIVIVANLKPVVLRGEKSQGMLLAASDKKRVGLLTTDAKLNSRVSAGKEAIPKKQIEIGKVLKAKLVSKDGKIFYKHRRLYADSKEVVCDKDISGKVR